MDHFTRGAQYGPPNEHRSDAPIEREQPARLERRSAPFLPHFGWRPGQNDFPVALVSPIDVFGARELPTPRESGEIDVLSQIEVLSAPRRSSQPWTRVAAIAILIVGVSAGGLGLRALLDNGNSSQPAAGAISDDEDTADRIEPTPTIDIPRFSQPGFGGGVPAPLEEDAEGGDEPTSTATATEEIVMPGSGVVTVSARPGDTLLDMAEKFDVSVASLIWSNNIEDPTDYLEDGVTIRVPKEDGVVHEVRAGDTLQSIAERYGVEPEAILSETGNGLDSAQDLSAGELILVPGGVVTDRGSIAQYTVQEGDTLASIAGYYGLQPETLAWANVLPRPDLIHPGQELVIPPGDGALIAVEEGDTVDAIAARFEVDPQTILDYEFNNLDDGSLLQIGQEIMVPGDVLPDLEMVDGPLTGESVAGEGVTGPATGEFLWPTEGFVSQEFHAGHSGLDIANEEWTPVNAADGGIVIFAGWSDHGLGYAVGIDHGNGYQTWYGHLATQPYVEVGQVIWQGGYLGPMGTTGKSTGPHLHFVVLKDGVYQNPLDYLS